VLPVPAAEASGAVREAVRARESRAAGIFRIDDAPFC